MDVVDPVDDLDSEPPVPPFVALVLAGGAGARLGGVDKAEIDTGRGTLLRRALDATSAARQTVVVGPVRGVPDGVLSAQEQPPGGGPVAAVAAGLTALGSAQADGAAIVVVLACDMPFVDRHAVARLAAVLDSDDSDDSDGVIYVDATGRRQYLAAAYRAAALSAAITAVGDPAGASMRSVVDRLTVREIAAHPDLTLDCDTWQDVERTRQLLEDR